RTQSPSIAAPAGARAARSNLLLSRTPTEQADGQLGSDKTAAVAAPSSGFASVKPAPKPAKVAKVNKPEATAKPKIGQFAAASVAMWLRIKAGGLTKAACRLRSLKKRTNDGHRAKSDLFKSRSERGNPAG